MENLERAAETTTFATTSWSLVARAGGGAGGTTPQRDSLGVLLKRYLPAMRAYLDGQRQVPPDRVPDLLQGFVADKIIEQNLIAQADRQRGKFRSFLLMSLKRYVIDEHRRREAAKRSPEGALTTLESAAEVAINDEPSRNFDLAWARELVNETLQRMKRECERSGRTDLWEVFDCRVVGPAFLGTAPLEYDHLVERFGLPTPLHASNLLTTAKRMFARTLRSVAAEYADDDQLVEEEIQDLLAIVSLGRA
ncbi:MAG TPA: hypothetical protein VM008_09780 [Phycisphaerae bacterium]|nr:hypothetical protein [Phycisphaerae bacterium]